MILVDSNIIFDIIDNDPKWGLWSVEQMRRCATTDDLAINAVVYAEISPRFTTTANVDGMLSSLGIAFLQIPRSAAFLAGKAFIHFRRKGGPRSNVLPDFFIGAHAAALGCAILTRDIRRYSTYFPNVRLISP
jgi:predicted nucleic acid-binding protein